MSVPPRDRLASIEMLVCDVDGVLTDGRLTYRDDGEGEKTFHARDGMGIRLLQDVGVEVAILTARSGGALTRRMQDLKVERVFQGRGDKGRAIRELIAQAGRDPARVAYIGDDVLDLPALRAVGLGITVADGHPLVLREAGWITAKKGGYGAVREVADALCEAREGLAEAVERLLDNL